jgi:hypothetical protein
MCVPLDLRLLLHCFRLTARTYISFSYLQWLLQARIVYETLRFSVLLLDKCQMGAIANTRTVLLQFCVLLPVARIRSFRSVNKLHEF